MRFPSSINFSTWTPQGWDPTWDQQPLTFARLVGCTIQRRGLRNIDTGGGAGIAMESPEGAILYHGYNP